MGSTRLPGKVLLDLGGDTVLARVVRRVRRAKLISEIVIATTASSQDDRIVAECKRLCVNHFRGEELDVLDRYYHAAQASKADAVVRITSDCPLIEPEVTDKVVRVFLDDLPDYASNTQTRTYPRGLDTEIMTAEALARAWKEASKGYQRVHVTPYLYENPDKFRIRQIVGQRDYSGYRWTLDTPEDLTFLRTVLTCVGNDDRVKWTEILRLLERDQDLAKINQHVAMKALREG